MLCNICYINSFIWNKYLGNGHKILNGSRKRTGSFILYITYKNFLVLILSFWVLKVNDIITIYRFGQTTNTSGNKKSSTDIIMAVRMILKHPDCLYLALPFLYICK